MKEIIYLSDFIEGKSVVASVRYEQMLKYIGGKYNLIVVNDRKYGEFKSSFSKINYKFTSFSSKYSKEWSTEGIKKLGLVERILRKNKYVLSLWRNFSHSKYLFNFKNKDLYRNLYKCIGENNIKAIFVTVPDIYVLYIAENLKKMFPEIHIIVEVRDIINHNIGIGNPKYEYKKAEKTLLKISDGIITLSEDIYKYYYKKAKNSNIKIIRNGYCTQDFMDCENKIINIEKDGCLKLAHVGSIYAGRNIKSFMEALIELNHELSIKIIFNIVGFLDGKAIEDISSFEDKLRKSNIEINMTGTIPHDEAIKYLKAADIAVVLTHEVGSDYAIPGKVFEYIGSCTPIIAVTEDKGLVNLVDGKYGECAAHNSEEIMKKLLKIINTKYCFDDRFKFSRKIQAENIINFIEDTISIKNHNSI